MAGTMLHVQRSVGRCRHQETEKCGLWGGVAMVREWWQGPQAQICSGICSDDLSHTRVRRAFRLTVLRCFSKGQLSPLINTNPNQYNIIVFNYQFHTQPGAGYQTGSFSGKSSRNWRWRNFMEIMFGPDYV